jgi:signal-transduction protein with cAMP-binding, CBS, and nucleotidyltransferase domain
LTAGHAKPQDRKVSTVSDILGETPAEVVRIDGGAKVFDAVKAMVEADIGAVLVTEGGRPVGIFTERDYLRRIAVEGRTSHETLVREVMSAPVIYVTPETPVDETMALMSNKRIRHLPVVRDSDVIGMLSIRDLVDFRSKEQSFQIQYLTDYITAR